MWSATLADGSVCQSRACVRKRQHISTGLHVALGGQQAHVQSCGREGPSVPGWGAEDPAHGSQILPKEENRGEALGCVQGELEGAEAA